MRARCVWLAGIMAVGALLGGCADDEAPSTLPEVTGSPTTATPPAESNTAEPESVDEEIRRFYTEYTLLADESFTSSAALEESRRYFKETCTSCAAGYDIAAEVVGNGYIFEGDPTEIVDLEVDSAEGTVVVFRAVLDVPSATIRDAAGNVVREYPPTSNVTTVYTAQKQDNRWFLIADEVLG